LQNNLKQRIYFICVVAALLATTATFLADSLLEILAPFQIEGSEGIVLYQAQKITDFTAAYKPIEQYPYVVFHYPPVYHLATRILEKWTGDLVLAGRLVSFISILSIELVFGVLVFFCLPRKLDLVSRHSGALFAALLPSFLYVARWTRTARVDTLAVFLCVAGAAVFVLGAKRRWTQYIAFALFVAAVFTKQTMVAAPLACFLVLAVTDFKRAAELAVFVLVVGISILAGLSWATDGEALKHLFAYNQNPFSFQRGARLFAENVSPLVGVVALAAGVAVATAIGTWRLYRTTRWDRIRVLLDHRPSYRLSAVWSLLFLFAVLVSLLAGKNGSSYNYFLESNLALCPLAGIAVCRIQLMLRRRRSHWTSAHLVLLLLPLFALVPRLPHALGGARILVSGFDHYRGELPGQFNVDTSERVQAYQEVLKIVQEAPGPVFSEDMLLLVRAGKEVPAEPAIIRQLALQSKWDERPFLRMIAEKRFPVIVITSDIRNDNIFSPGVAQAIEDAYEETQNIADQFRVYRPRQ
jgi:hypothetical protein